jgi:NadR type nicotinamide-nucleotide adenylyltransferase
VSCTIYFRGVLKVVVTGPESSGKTTLAQALAAHFGTVWVPEAARAYLAARDTFSSAGPYLEKDLLDIARSQLRAEDHLLASIRPDAPQLIICDTDLITIRIWGEDKYGRSDPWVLERTVERPYDLWLLCRPDMPWEPDPLRENPHDRDRLLAVYERTLQALDKPYLVLSGPHAERMERAVSAIDLRLGRSAD